MMGHTRSLPTRSWTSSRHSESAAPSLSSAQMSNARERRSSKRMGAEGHSIGNHSYSHADLTTLAENEVRDEIRSTESLFGGLPNAERIFRPPYGASNPTVDRVARELNYRKVLWNVDSRDWDPAYKPHHWVARALYRIHRRKRSIVLAHDIHRTTADHLADLIERIGDAQFRNLQSPDAR